MFKATINSEPSHLKVKDTYRVGYQSNQELMHHCISMQKISSIYKFILKIQQIIESHELKEHAHFGPHQPQKSLK